MTLPVSKLEIGAFRGLERVSFPELGRVNLFLGGTNSGKTSVLEAIALLDEPQSPLTWVRVANRREPSPWASLTSSLVDRLRYLFPLRDGKPEKIELTFSGRTEIREIRARYEDLAGQRRAERFDRETGESLVVDEDRMGLGVSVEVVHKQMSLVPEEPSRWEVWEGEPVLSRRRSSSDLQRSRVRTISPYEHWLRPHPTREFSEGVFEGRESATVELLKKIDPKIEEVRVLTLQREPTLYFKYEGAGLLPVSAFGDGIRRALTMALVVPRASGGLLLIDEIETGLHVSMLARMFTWLIEACQEHDVQLCVTTHSLEAVDALLEADKTVQPDTIAFHLRRAPGSTSVTRYGEADLRRLRHERGLDLR